MRSILRNALDMRGSNRDEAVHVGRAVDERPEAAREVAAVEKHDGQREQELRSYIE